MRELHVKIVPSTQDPERLSLRPTFGDSVRDAITETFEPGEAAVLVSQVELRAVLAELERLQGLTTALGELSRAQDKILIRYRSGNFRNAGGDADRMDAAREKVEALQAVLRQASGAEEPADYAAPFQDPEE